MLQIGITGGIGTGKSLVCKIFKCLGIKVYDADSRAKYLMTTDGILISHIRKEFGDLSFDSEGNINRKYLAGEVFSDPVKLETLNRLVHPRVAVDYARWLEANKDEAYVLKEAALLYESGSFETLDKIIVVYAPENIRIDRVLKRDKHRTEQQVKEIIARQWTEVEKMKRADIVVYNDESRLLIPQILSLHHKFLQI